MEIVIENISRNRNIQHNIFDIPIGANSYSASLLLNEMYRGLDISFDRQNDWRYYFIVRRHYLRKVKRNGHWVCHYCGNPVYKMPTRNKNRQYTKDCITVDHKIPASKCDDKLDTSNFLQCCYDCNNKKGDTPYKIFVQKYLTKFKEKNYEITGRYVTISN